MYPQTCFKISLTKISNFLQIYIVMEIVNNLAKNIKYVTRLP